MKKINDNIMANFLGITRQSIHNMKKKRPQQYEAIKTYLLLIENNFFEKLKKAKSLAELISQECNNKYADDLVKLTKENDEVIKEILITK